MSKERDEARKKFLIDYKAHTFPYIEDYFPGPIFNAGWNAAFKSKALKILVEAFDSCSDDCNWQFVEKTIVQFNSELDPTPKQELLDPKDPKAVHALHASCRSFKIRELISESPLVNGVTCRICMSKLKSD